MRLRVARHTRALEPLIRFYVDILGLEHLGGFQDHDGYDGCFLGKPGLDWHLEFTTSADVPDHHPDEDDVLVFYVATTAEYQAILDRCNEAQLSPAHTKNPYWHKNGHAVADPDGFIVLIVSQNT